MTLGLLVLRVIVGALFAGHGAQKLFGWFGGHGVAGTGQFFESLHLRPGRLMAIGAGLGELGGGLLLALGLVTPLAAALVIAVMATAVATVHWSKGPWITDGGYEYNLVLAASAFAVSAGGPGRWSLDHVLGVTPSGVQWAVGALVVGLLAALLTLAVGRFEARHGSGDMWPTAT
jgi:putative oxidoreductase